MEALLDIFLAVVGGAFVIVLFVFMTFATLAWMLIGGAVDFMARRRKKWRRRGRETVA